MPKKGKINIVADPAALFDLMADAVVVLDRECRIQFCNRKYARTVGRQKKQIIGEKIEDLGQYEGILMVREAVEELFSGTRRRVRFQSRRQDPDGSFVEVDVGCQAVRFDGKVKGVLLVARNIAALEKTRRDLERQKKQYRRLIDNMNELLLVVDVEGKIIFCNEAYALLRKTSVKKLIGRSFFDKIYPDDIPVLRGDLKNLIEGRSEFSTHVFRLIAENDLHYSLEGYFRPVKFEGEKPAAEIIGRNITEREIARRKLEKANKKLEKRQKQLMRDLDLASKIHRSLLPGPKRNSKIISDIKHIPLMGLGGDYASVQFYMQRYLAVSIFDVTGHGLAASLLAGRVHSEIYRLVRNNYPPGRIIKAINSFVYNGFGGTGLFLTIFCVRINFLSGHVRYSGGGHPPMMVKRKATGKVEMLDSESPLAGVVRPEQFKETEGKLNLRKEDILVLYTDGISDVLGQKNNTSGIRELADLLAGMEFSEVRNNISAYICSHIEPLILSPPKDDMTILAAKLQ